MLSKPYFFLCFSAFISSYSVVLKPHILLKLSRYYEAILFIQRVWQSLCPIYSNFPNFSCSIFPVLLYINTSTNRWQMEAPMGTEINPKAFMHKMSLRQAAEGKRKGSLNVFKRKKGLTVLSCSLENHAIN